MTPRRISLHIEELVLHGFSPRDREGVGGAVQRELARLLAEHGVPAAWLQAGGAERWEAGTITLPANAQPAALGTRVARAVLSELRPRGGRP